MDFAEEMNCAVIGITHFTKGTAGKDPVERVTGSLAISAVARVIWVAIKNKGGEPERMFIMVKNILAPCRGAFGYSIVGSTLMEGPDIIASRVMWGEAIEGSARDLLAEAEDNKKKDEGAESAQAFLFAALMKGGRPQKEIAAEGAERGFSADRLFRASKEMGVVKRKEGMDGPWLWKLT